MSELTTTPAVEQPRSRGAALLAEYKIPLAITVGVFAVLAAFSWNRFLHQSKAPHFVYQAQAFLEGRLDLPVDPPNQEDWVKIEDRFYVSFPAMPAVLMMPFVALWHYQFNDTSFTVGVAALAIALFFLLLRKLSREGDTKRTDEENVAFALLFAFGTLFFYMSIRGEVWFTAQIMGVASTCLYLLTAHKAKRPVLAGFCYSLATLTRTPLLFAGIYFVAEALFPEGTLTLAELQRDVAAKVKKIGLFALGALPLAGAHAAFNYVRFGKLGEFGHSMLWNNRVNADIQKYGLFNYQYLERNLTAAFTRLPTISLHPLQIGYDAHGLSLLLTTPLFLLLLWPREKPRLHRILWLTVACTALPGFFYQNDGYMQFGFRFSMDYTPYLLLLIAVGGWSMRTRLFVVCAAIGVAVNTWGAIAFRGFSW